MARILIVAGEASGDRLGGMLLREVKEVAPHHSFVGVGDWELEAQGVELLVRSHELDVVGGLEAVSRLPRLYYAYTMLKDLILSRKVDALLLIDYPGMNLKLAQLARSVGLPVVYYVSPQIWAWRPGRIKRIRRSVNLMLVILPFEEEIYRRAHVPVAYVGHPLLDVVKPKMGRGDFRRLYGLPLDGELVALLPGSRKQELDYLLEGMVRAAEILAKVRGTAFVLPVAPTLSLEDVEARWSRLVKDRDINCVIMQGDTYSAVAAADAALVASGTATLEAALLGTPQVLVYRVNPVTYAIGKRLVRVKWLSLVNIILGAQVIPELVQSKAKAPIMAREIETLLDGGGEEMGREMARLRDILGPPGASARAARRLAAFLEERGL